MKVHSSVFFLRGNKILSASSQSRQLRNRLSPEESLMQLSICQRKDGEVSEKIMSVKVSTIVIQCTSQIESHPRWSKVWKWNKTKTQDSADLIQGSAMAGLSLIYFHWRIPLQSVAGQKRSEGNFSTPVLPRNSSDKFRAYNLLFRLYLVTLECS